MLKADIRLPIIIPIVAIVLSIVFSFFKFSPMTIVIYLGSSYLIIYYILGYARKSDALIIDSDKIMVKTPFRYREWAMDEITKIYIADGNTQLKAEVIIEETERKTITLCNAIYTKNILDIYQYLININPSIK